MITGAKAANSAHTWLTSLARDTRGNTIAIVAASIIPLAGMVGGGVDISRMYIVKTRLQHACDAGALAGRKAMGGGTWGQTVNGTDNYPNAAAERFFDANFDPNAYGTRIEDEANRRRFTESAGKVTGSARAIVPMTLMRIFGKDEETLRVTCSAEMRLPNTDVMFVLDVTGSMRDTPSGDSQSKLQSLKDSVKCFYEIVARLDTEEECTTGAPSGGTGTQTQIRFGFVPYDTNVNVGYLLPTNFIADSWTYQTREPIYEPRTEWQWDEGDASVTGTPQITSEERVGSWETQTSGDGATTAAGATSKNACNNLDAPDNDSHTLTGSEGSPYDQHTSSGNPRTVTWKTEQDGWYYRYRYSWSNRTCLFQRATFEYELVRNYTRTDTLTQVTVQVFRRYRYAPISKDIRGLKNGTLWNTSLDVTGIGRRGATKTVNWTGCIEERRTVRATNYSPIPADAEDLDIDQVPSAGDPNSLWGPALPGMIYTRYRNGNWSYDPVESEDDFGNSSSASCPTEARKLQAWPTASEFEDYVDRLSPGSNTYHDIGLLWGARLMSPTGIFADENDFTPQGGEIERHLIFMTDGDPCTGTFNYNAYGVAWFDRRQTDTASAPTEGCTNTGTLTQQVNARTAAICTAVKAKNITLWVITFGSLAQDTITRMTACATPGRYFHATNAATLQATFKSIADQISALRLTN